MKDTTLEEDTTINVLLEKSEIFAPFHKIKDNIIIYFNFYYQRKVFDVKKDLKNYCNKFINLVIVSIVMKVILFKNNNDDDDDDKKKTTINSYAL